MEKLCGMKWRMKQSMQRNNAQNDFRCCRVIHAPLGETGVDRQPSGSVLEHLCLNVVFGSSQPLSVAAESVQLVELVPKAAPAQSCQTGCSAHQTNDFNRKNVLLFLIYVLISFSTGKSLQHHSKAKQSKTLQWQLTSVFQAYNRNG